LGGGAVQIGQETDRDEDWDVSQSPEWTRTRNNEIVDNRIQGFGQVFHRSVAFVAVNVSDTRIDHNHVYDGYHGGLAAGGHMGYHTPGVDKNNRFAWNHFHDLGKGLLSDFGGFYIRGYNPETVVKGNLIHDLHEYGYGAWGLYPDLGASGITWEQNVIYNTKNNFHLHYGSGNLVQNNVFALPRETAVKISDQKMEDGYDYNAKFQRNIFYTEDRPMFFGGHDSPIEAMGHVSNHNLFWDTAGEVRFGRGDQRRTLEEMRSAGFETDSVTASPEFANPAAGEFSLADSSPALGPPVNFEPIDLSRVGVRSE
jgi:hypothetical protein